MVVCKVCVHLGKKLTRTKSSKKLRGLCEIKAHTGRMDIEEEEIVQITQRRQSIIFLSEVDIPIFGNN
jgi:hypothetical protein